MAIEGRIGRKGSYTGYLEMLKQDVREMYELSKRVTASLKELKATPLEGEVKKT